MLFDLFKKLFSKDVEVSTQCDHGDIVSDYDGPSTTRVVLILTASSVLVFSVGYMIRPVLDLVREVYRDNRNVNVQFKQIEDLDEEKLELVLDDETDNIEMD